MTRFDRIVILTLATLILSVLPATALVTGGHPDARAQAAPGFAGKACVRTVARPACQWRVSPAVRAVLRPGDSVALGYRPSDAETRVQGRRMPDRTLVRRYGLTFRNVSRVTVTLYLWNG